MKVSDANNNDAILKTYIHANGQVLAQHNGSFTADRYFYLHDRLGSVRMVIDANGTVKNHYTYDPWGYAPALEAYESVDNLYRFAGYAFDVESLTYYCINRIYDPVLGRFTSRDPVQGNYQEPMTLHRYLYCINNPINMTDPTGKLGIPGLFIEFAEIYEARNVAITSVLNSASDAFEAAEGLASVHNTIAALVETRQLVNRAFGAIECVTQSRGKLLNTLVDDCGYKGTWINMGIAAGSLACLATGPAMSACFFTYGIVSTVGSTALDVGCIMGAVAEYTESLYECMK